MKTHSFFDRDGPCNPGLKEINNFEIAAPASTIQGQAQQKRSSH
jgi:hypothetical protein